jgi:hypothetical protein
MLHVNLTVIKRQLGKLKNHVDFAKFKTLKLGYLGLCTMHCFFSFLQTSIVFWCILWPCVIHCEFANTHSWYAKSFLQQIICKKFLIIILWMWWAKFLWYSLIIKDSFTLLKTTELCLCVSAQCVCVSVHSVYVCQCTVCLCSVYVCQCTVCMCM